MHDGIEMELLARCEQGVEAALRAGADQAEVYAEHDRELSVGFQKNDLDSVATHEEATLGIRVLVGGRPGFATTNSVATLDQVVAEAVATARSSPRDDTALIPEPLRVTAAPALVDPALLALGPAELARLGSRLLAMILAQRDPRVPGGRISIDNLGLSVTHGARAVASSTGVRAAHRSAAAQGGIFGMAIDGAEVGSFSYDGDAVRRAEELEPALERAFLRFGEKCLGALGATTGESFRGPILLPADVVEEFLVGELVSALGADSIRSGMSPFKGRVGERIAAPGFTLVEGGAGLDGHPLTPFDREGMPRQRTVLVEDGVLKGFLYDSYEARQAGTRSTGHATGGAASLPRVGATCLSLEGGDRPLAELSRLERGVLVTRFSGTTDASSGDFSGVVKGGFLVRDGQLRPIKETTIAGNLWTALTRISGRSAETETFQGTRRYPSLVIEDVSITAG